ncbi:MAG: hypothetical protein WC592_04975 [Candidatus Omnitrophota bacterium]|nr:hypothetical protein [Candidatus Omnitrophota bacterium]
MKDVYWIAGIALTAVGFIFTEGTLIATTKMFGVVRATLLRVVFTIPLSWLVIYLSTNADVSLRFRDWVEKKREGLSSRAQAIVKGGEFIAVLNTTVFLGPIIASILMSMIGVNTRRIYLYAVFCAFLSAWAWCAFYSGMFWGLGKIF